MTGDYYWYWDINKGEYLVREVKIIQKGKHKGKMQVKFAHKSGTRYAKMNELRPIKKG